ncbi:hypothetical protein GGR50DRAFT_516331 [Xylaria sp. CBS 124048]|nr:hypothetical protein GGR50DRAFT_516331 [Xylaria sp. CBS 124048]
MADRFRIGLKTFEISSKTFDLSLSMTSTAFIYHIPLCDTTPDHLTSLIQSKQLWLLPRGPCRLDVHVQLPECDARTEETVDFLEFIADTICQSSLWAQLGLTIKVLDVQCHPDEDNIPSLYFSIEPPDMSTALLSPPHTHTAHFKGLECVLQFNPSSHSPAENEQIDLEFPSPGSQTPPLTEVSSSYFTTRAPDLAKRWEIAACLVEAALTFMLGTRKRIRGLAILELNEAPSLLDLAPAIWNSHYLKCTANHAKNFSLISNILASSANGQSPELRRKGAQFWRDSSSGTGDGYNSVTPPSPRLLESCIDQRLWDLLRVTLKPTMGMVNITCNAISSCLELDRQSYEANISIINQGGVVQHRSSYENHYSHGNLSPPASEGHASYQTNANHNSNVEHTRREGGSDNTWGFQDSELYEEVLESNDRIDHFYFRDELPGPQLSQAYDLRSRLNLSNMSQDHDMSGWVYDTYNCPEAGIPGAPDYELTTFNTWSEPR